MSRCQSVSAPPLDALLRFEELAMNAWPAAVVQSIDGWRHRHTDGVSRRANSVWPCQPLGEVSLERRIESAEAFYAARGADACFQLSPAGRPVELDAALAARGYVENGATFLQTAAVDDVVAALARAAGASRAPSEPAARTQPGAGAVPPCAEDASEDTDGRTIDVVLTAAPDPAWEGVAWPEPSLRPDVRRAILGRVGPGLVCALARIDGQPAAAGAGVLERGRVGLSCMRTDPRWRRRGLAAAILYALTHAARRRGAHTAWLQVETDNHGALSLYRGAGFRTMYRYHYRTRKLAP